MLRGTHLGEFPPGVGPARIMGAMPPTGRSFEADQIHITRVGPSGTAERSLAIASGKTGQITPAMFQCARRPPSAAAAAQLRS
jgi:hypothetical protein